MSERDPRAEEMLADPQGYFKRARKEARKVVERDMERERQLAWRAAGVNPPTERRSITMPETSILRTALYILGAALLLCLGGIIWLSSANPARSIPDVLVATTGLVSGGIVGILVPTKSLARGEGGQTNIIGAVIGVLLVVILVVLILRLA